MVKKKKGNGIFGFFYKKKVEKGTIPSRNKKKPEDEEELGVGSRSCLRTRHKKAEKKKRKK